MTAYRTGYGTGLYGVRAYGLDGSVINADAVVSCAATATSAGERARTAVADVSSVVSIDVDARRATAASAVIAASAAFAASARLKWEPEPITAEIWTDVPETAEIWTEVA
jgi:hypothetical protein